jgi:glycosyltransferase involved in cell wall biosynthesis
MTLKVSVVIPVFNGDSTIVRAVESVLTQTHPPFEIIVINDASTDDTASVLEQLAQTSGIPLIVMTNSDNVGPGVSRNVGWSHARGDLIAFLDADDVWHPQKLEIQVQVFESKPDVMMACHDRTVGLRPTWQPINGSVARWQRLEFRQFLIRNRCATPSVVVRRTIPERFNTSLRFAEDFHLWLTLTSRYGPVYYVAEALVHCANPSYGGNGLSGQLWLMYKSEIRGMLLLTKSNRLSLTLLLPVMMWSSLKFVVRLFDNLVLKNRLQTVSESR